MDESRKQKLLYGVLAITVALTLAINFWPERARPDDGFAPIQTITVNADPNDPQIYNVHREPMEEPAVSGRSRRSVSEASSPSIRRSRSAPVEKDELVPSV
ncbi:MAG: hypothetical protein C4547_12905 [Phycisphaerales bacterium]|nr:MAG: hypothetical protein C4547_12905 [Phycisphaerales bacterium]